MAINHTTNFRKSRFNHNKRILIKRRNKTSFFPSSEKKNNFLSQSSLQKCYYIEQRIHVFTSFKSFMVAIYEESREVSERIFSTSVKEPEKRREWRTHASSLRRLRVGDSKDEDPNSFSHEVGCRGSRRAITDSGNNS